MIARCRFFVVPGDSPALLGMPDIELLAILKIMCDLVGDQQANRKFDSDNGTAQHCKLQSKHRLGEQVKYYDYL